MKKYIYVLLAFMAIFTSCSNDDITIRTATNFKINPSTVIAPFTWEYESGDLESFNTDYRLRIRLLIYNSDGLLEAEDIQYFSNYIVTMNSTINLPVGNYNAIVITDLVGQTSDAVEEFWTLSNYERLADTHIDDVGYIGGKEKILGITNQNFSVDRENSNEISIDVKPVGAIFFVQFMGIHAIEEITRYSLACAKTANQCIFNINGSYSIAEENNNGSYDWRICFVEPQDYPNYSGTYGYYYVLPVSNLNLKFQYNTETEEKQDLTPVMTINPQAGEEWAFELNMQDMTYSCVKVNGQEATSLSTKQQSDIATTAEIQQIQTMQRIHLKNIR